jgi:transposase
MSPYRRSSKKTLEPLILSAQKGNCVAYFVDAAHFVMGGVMGSVWSKKRVFVQTPSGRSRLNVLGAINPINQKLLTVVNEAYINADSVCELLRKIRKAHPNRDIPVKLVMDNARYQRCKLVDAQAKALGIEIVFLPPYSPHFNLIERLWKFVKKTCLYSCYYHDFATYKQSILDCLANTNHIHKAKLKKLLNPKFQSFRNVRIICG